MSSQSQQEELSRLLASKDIKGAFSLLQSDPTLLPDVEASRCLLNQLFLLESSSAEPNPNPNPTLSLTPNMNPNPNPNPSPIPTANKAQQEAAQLIYRRISAAKHLRGFGCIRNEWPEKSRDITPLMLETITNMNITALTPGQRTNYWQVAGVAILVAELVVSARLHIEPWYILPALTIGAVAYDQIALGGAAFESVYQKMFPVHRDKILHHEAGHFLCAYLLGCPVEKCVLNPWQARMDKRFRGQAGTVFFDQKLFDEIRRGAITRATIDRFSVVVMGGIAAEALYFGRAEGGAVDEGALISFVAGVSPPWDLFRMQAQARWGVVQAVLLIKEHRAAFDALVSVLKRGGGVGDCVFAIEANLPAVLPAEVRHTKIVEEERDMSNELLLKWGRVKVNQLLDKIHKLEAKEEDLKQVVPVQEPPPSPKSVIETFVSKLKELEQGETSGTVADEQGVWLTGVGSQAASSEVVPANETAADLTVLGQATAFVDADALAHETGGLALEYVRRKITRSSERLVQINEKLKELTLATH